MAGIKDFLRVIKTERLEMRPMEPTTENAQILFDALKNERQEDHPFGPFAGVYGVNGLPKNTEQALARMNQWAEWDKENGISLGVFYGGNLIGVFRMFFFGHNDTFQFMETFLIKSARRKGFASEVIKFFERVAFDELGANSITWWCVSENEASQSVIKKNGYHLDGVFRETVKKRDGTFYDEMCWSKLRTEYYRK